MNTMPAIRPIGYSPEAVLYGYQGMHIVDAGTIGRMLHPEAKDPARQILNTYNRNKGQFTDKDTVLLDVEIEHLRVDLRNHSDYADATKTTFVTQKRKTRFFSLPYGVMKICAFSQSANKAVVIEKLMKMHEAFIRGTLARWDRSIATVGQIPKWIRGRGEVIRKVAIESGVSTMTIRRHVDRLAKGEPISKNCPGMRQYCHKKYRDIKDEVIRLAQEGLKAKDIAQRLGVPLKTVYRWINNII